MSEPVGTLTDAALVRAAQAGDTAGLGALLERHRVSACTRSRSASSAMARRPRTPCRMRA